MKRTMLCVFSLIFILLLTCTILSFYVAEQMTPQVVPVRAEVWYTEESMISGGSLPADALRVDENGMEYVWFIREQEGWQKGKYAEKFLLSQYSLDEKGNVVSAMLFSDQFYVRYTSKPITDGEALQTAANPSARSGLVLLAVDPDSAELLPAAAEELGYTVDAANGTRFLLSSDSVSDPFFEEQLVSQFRDHGVFIQSAVSLRELGAFTDSLLPLAFCGALFCVLLLLWGLFCRGILRQNRMRYIVWPFIAAALAGIWTVLHTVHLPSSLLPERMILDFSHYGRQFQESFTALEMLGAESVVTACQNQMRPALLIMVGAAVICIAAFLVSGFLTRPQRGRHFR